MSGRPAGQPAYLWLWYSDGVSSPEADPYCTGIQPPAFTCTYGATIEACQRQVQLFLDAWYADLNVVFTLTRPPSGDYYTMIITSDWPKCQQGQPDPAEAGVALVNCNDNLGATAIAFKCGYNAHDCAMIIAHEHGHMVGLEHTTSSTGADVMNATIVSTASGFEDQLSNTLDLKCQAKQNSYQQMLSALGSWPGGAKPSPLLSLPDAGAADAAHGTTSGDAGDTAATGGSLGGPTTNPIDAGQLVALPGFDALTRPPRPISDASLATASSKGGCSFAGRTSSSPGAAAIVALLLALAAVATRIRGQFPCGRRARRASERLPCGALARWPSAARPRDCPALSRPRRW